MEHKVTESIRVGRKLIPALVKLAALIIFTGGTAAVVFYTAASYADREGETLPSRIGRPLPDPKVQGEFYLGSSKSGYVVPPKQSGTVKLDPSMFSRAPVMSYRGMLLASPAPSPQAKGE